MAQIFNLAAIEPHVEELGAALDGVIRSAVPNGKQTRPDPSKIWISERSALAAFRTDRDFQVGILITYRVFNEN